VTLEKSIGFRLLERRVLRNIVWSKKGINIMWDKITLCGVL
jgi:hypothetical protein